MKKTEKECRLFPTAKEDLHAARLCIDSPQTQSSSYKLAYEDQEFLIRNELRPVRLQLELLKPELIQQEQNILSTVVIFGSARIPDPQTARKQHRLAQAAAEDAPTDLELTRTLVKAKKALANSKYYEEARKLARLISICCQDSGSLTHVVTTGGGPGIMEAANRGAHDVAARSIGLNIVLPHEQAPNPYITPELSFQFHYFAIRKMHFLMRAKALVVFPGGFGTLDELFDVLTLVQTKKMKPIPILLFGEGFWKQVINFEALVEEGNISPQDLQLFKIVETAEEAWQEIAKTNGLPTEARE